MTKKLLSMLLGLTLAVTVLIGAVPHRKPERQKNPRRKQEQRKLRKAKKRHKAKRRQREARVIKSDF